jgi:ABC-type transport system substrate-binding protein
MREFAAPDVQELLARAGEGDASKLSEATATSAPPPADDRPVAVGRDAVLAAFARARVPSEPAPTPRPTTQPRPSERQPECQAVVWDMLYGVDAELQPRRQMVESEETSPDGTVWTFRLRPGLKFHTANESSRRTRRRASIVGRPASR